MQPHGVRSYYIKKFFYVTTKISSLRMKLWCVLNAPNELRILDTQGVVCRTGSFKMVF